MLTQFDLRKACRERYTQQERSRDARPCCRYADSGRECRAEGNECQCQGNLGMIRDVIPNSFVYSVAMRDFGSRCGWLRIGDWQCGLCVFLTHMRERQAA